ncbi:ferritin family protein [Desulfovibrio sp. JC022]|uniref:ferritin-like domain-containing protein n=1 Tax=Desulfovibrio sp. JC022 TaxID=2593642 RepID=UPI0010AAF601|nr:ferritin family protein [Desulfovibrio sp. JC022]NDV22646.1 rubrerythrin [Desulfovibrio sp. JC022]TIH16473.1 rubrerythrin [Marinifilum sp. JC120]
MVTFFSANEVAELAMRIEQKGQAFYLLAADEAKDPAAKEFFEFFAEEESRHELFFRDMRDRIGSIEIPPGSDYEEYTQYVMALVDSHDVFNFDYTAAFKDEDFNFEQAVRAAMRFEKDTILLFTELKRMVPDTERKFVEECIDEERKHLRMLAEKLS